MSVCVLCERPASDGEAVTVDGRAAWLCRRCCDQLDAEAAADVAAVTEACVVAAQAVVVPMRD